MNRADLQTLSEERLGDGVLLLQAGRHSGAYYMLGYAVECALKAAVAKQIREHDFPDKKLVSDSHTHDLNKLLSLSGLRAAFDVRTRTDSAFAVNWATTKDWNESFRYSTSVSDILARDLHAAISDPINGVLPWLRTQW